MKKFINIAIIIFIVFTFIFSGSVFADERLESFNIDVNKTNVKPGEQVTLTVNFGAQLGAYTVTIDFDDDVFDFVSIDNGSHSVIDGKLKVVFSDSTGGNATKDSMKAIFKAKEELVTSNPTEFSVTATGMASGDTRTTYEDISSAHVKEVIVEPEYKDYVLDLKYDGTIVAGQAKDMVISFASEMGKNYEKARLIAVATMPEGATVELVGRHEGDNTDYDIIKTGWGNPQGYAIGGKNISQNLNFKGTFSQDGEYGITLKLIDRSNSDAIIAQKDFKVVVGETIETPIVLPKTGINIYIPIFFILLGIIAISVIFNRKNNKFNNY